MVAMRQRVWFVACFALCAWLAIASPSAVVAQTNGTWKTTTGGTWGDPANWVGGIADGTGAVADFSTLDITGVRTITLDGPRTSGTLLFGDTAGTNGGWTLTSSTLTLATTSGVPTISVTGMGISPTAAVSGTSVTISSVIAGSNGLNKSGSSALILAAANTYSGTTTVGAGYLVLNHNSALGNTSGVSVANGGALAIGNGITAGAGITASISNSSGVNSDGGLTAISGGTGTWAGSVATGGGRVGYQFSNLVISGSIGGSSGLSVSGYGGDPATSGFMQFGVTISGTNNTYTGATSIIRGVLKLGADNALPTATTLNVHSANNSGNSATFDLNGFNQTVGGILSSGILDAAGNVNGFASGFVTNSGSAVKTFTVNQTTSGTMAAIMTGNLAFTKTGAGNLLLRPVLVLSASNGVTGTNTFSGDTFISAGTLTLGNANALFGSAFDTASTGTLSLGTLSAATVGGLKNSGTFALTNSGSAFALSVGGNNVSSTFAGRLTGLGGLTKVGSGTFTLAGNANDYAGATTLAGGALALGSADALPASGAITFVGGALQYTASNTIDYTSRIKSSGSAVAIDTNGQDVTFTGGIDSTNTGGFRKLGAGTLTLSGSSGYMGTTTLAGGVLALNHENAIAAAGNVTFAGGSLRYSGSNTADIAARIASSTGAIAIDTNGQNVTWAGNLANTNTGGLTKTGAGTLTLSGTNAYSGNTTLSSGTLHFGAVDSWLSLSGTFLVSDATLLASTTNQNGNGWSSKPIVAGGAGITLGAGAGATRVDYNSVISGTGGVTFAGSTLGIGALNTYSGPTTIGPGVNLILSATGATGSGGAPISGAFGTGTVTLAGGSLRTFSGTPLNVVINNAVNVTADTAFAAAGNAAVSVVLAGPMTLVGGTRTFNTHDGGGNVVEFNGSISDGGNGFGLVKSGNRLLVLGGSNSYSGATTLAGGTMRLDNAQALAGGGNVVFTGGTLQYSASNTVDYSSRIAGSSSAVAIDTNGQGVLFASGLAGNSSGLTKSGSGTLTLTADGAYTGLTTVTGGTLQVGSGGASGSITGNVALSNTAALVFNRSSALAYPGSISGTGSFMKTGAGTLTLSGSNSYVGTTTIAGGTLAIANSNALVGSFTLDGGTIVNSTGFNSFGKGGGVPSFTVGPGGGAVRSDVRIDPASVISGTSSTAVLTYGPTTAGSSGILLVISGNNTYAANTKVEAGIQVVVDSNNAFGTGALELAGASIRSRSATPRSVANAVTFSANTQFFGSASDPNLTFTGSATLAGGTQTFQVDSVITSGSSAGQPGVIFTNVISDGGNGFGITKAGAGVLALGGANTYSGATTVNGGTIQMQNQAALQYSTLSLSGIGGVVFDSVVSGNAFTLGGLASSSSVPALALQNSAATAIALTVGGNGQSTTYAGTLTGPGSFEKVGSGSLVLTGSNTFAGTATVTTGSLQIGAGGTVGSLSANIVNNAAVVFNRSDASSYAGGISGSGSLTKSGAGTLTLSGSNSYGGATTLGGGALALAGANALPSSGDVTFTGGSLQYSGSYTTDLSSRIVSSSGVVHIDTNGQNIAFAGGLAASNVGGFRKSGAGTLALSASNAFTGPVTLAGGVLALDNAGSLPASGNVTFTGGALRYSSSNRVDLSSRIVSSTGAIAIDTYGENVTFASVINNTNTAGLSKSGAGTLTLSGANTYAGTTSVTGGTLAFTTDAVWNSASGTIALDGATLSYTGAAVTNAVVSRPMTLGAGGGSFRNTSPGFWFVNGQIAGAGPLTIASGSTLMVLAGANVNSGGVTLQAGAQVVVGADSSGPAGAPVSGAFGTGTLTLAGGSMRATTSAARSVGNAVSLAADTTFVSAGLNSDKSLTFTGPVTLAGGNRTLAVNMTGTDNPALVFNGAIGDGGNAFGLTKTGVGRLILAGANTYTGATVVSNGTLVVNGDQSAATGAVSIASVATLMGSGVIGGDATIAGFHNPGNSPGIQTFAGDLTYSGGASTVLWELGANTASNSPLAFDQIVVGGDLSFAGATVLSLSFNGTGSTVNWSDAFWDSSRTWTLYSVSGTTTGFGNLVLAGSPASWLDTQSTPQSLSAARPDATFSIVQDGSNVNVVYAVVPEPGALVLAGIGIAAAAWAIRRR